MPAQIRELKLRFTASDDGATSVINRVSRDIQKVGQDTGKIFGPAAKPRFSEFEQDVRAEMAQRLRIMRDAGQKEQARERSTEVRRAAEEMLGLPPISEATAAASNVGKATGRAVKDAVAAEVHAGGGFLATLKGAFGRGSQFKELAELAVGGGVVAGLSLALTAIDSMTSKMVELDDQFAAGKLSVGALVENLVKSLPILGQAWDIGRNIREVITHEERDTAKLVEHYQQLADENERFAEGVKKRQEYEKIANEYTRRTLLDIKALSMDTKGQALFQVDRQLDETIRQSDEERKAAIKANMQGRAGLSVIFKASSEKDWAARILAFEQKRIIERDAAMNQLEESARQAKSFRENLKREQAEGEQQGRELGRSIGTGVADFFNALPGPRERAEAEKNAAAFRPERPQGFTGESRLLTGVGGQFSNADLIESKNQTKIQQTISDFLTGTLPSVLKGAFNIVSVKPS